MANENNKKELFKILEDLRRRNKDSHFARANLWNEETNKSERSLGNILLTLATFLFVFTSPIFQRPEQFEETEKAILSVSWILLFLSILFGLLQVIIDVIYFYRGAERESEGEKLWSDIITTYEKYEKTSKESVRLYSNFSSHNIYIPIVLQAAFLVVAFGFILYTAISVLF